MSIEQDIRQKAFINPYQKLAVNLMFTNNWLVSGCCQLLKPYNLSEQQYHVLKILQEKSPEPSTVNYIIENMRDNMSNVSRLVDKLVAKGLVIRQQSLQDKRAVDIMITESGLDMVHNISQLISAWEANTIGLNEQEANELDLLLAKIRE
ncbi:MarR family winged helix-turn-helix transcriptional regulator [Flectobacillus major]|jgi:DNA-binding MarR family transcriptional regulator|uniref:MarR family winged helix-turn-helix transcriptional regulator n=1 Tax=Flectobacillus major TaxID=103 RepID=UPI00041866A2|nr:MarR family transcriptional regulator [Flectobacillus major]